jgi:CheY-like chemotaxis protein
MLTDTVVLVVDDDHAVLEAMQLLLEGSGGFKVHAAVGACSAHTYLTGKDHVDVIVADIILQGDISGLDICRHGRELLPDVGLVVISADPNAHREIIPPRSVYLRKPFGGRELLDAISRAGELTHPRVEPGSHAQGVLVS